MDDSRVTVAGCSLAEATEKEFPRLWDSFEPTLAETFKSQAGACDEVANGARDEHLSGSGGAGYACAGVDSEAGEEPETIVHRNDGAVCAKEDSAAAASRNE